MELGLRTGPFAFVSSFVTPALCRGPTLHNGIRTWLLVGCRNKSGMTVELDYAAISSAQFIGDCPGASGLTPTPSLVSYPLNTIEVGLPVSATTTG